eukprot:330285-Rhodomonas_salina.4
MEYDYPLSLCSIPDSHSIPPPPPPPFPVCPYLQSTLSVLVPLTRIGQNPDSQSPVLYDQVST